MNRIIFLFFIVGIYSGPCRAASDQVVFQKNLAKGKRVEVRFTEDAYSLYILQDGESKGDPVWSKKWPYKSDLYLGGDFILHDVEVENGKLFILYSSMREVMVDQVTVGPNPKLLSSTGLAQRFTFYWTHAGFARSEGKLTIPIKLNKISYGSEGEGETIKSVIYESVVKDGKLNWIDKEAPARQAAAEVAARVEEMVNAAGTGDVKTVTDFLSQGVSVDARSGVTKHWIGETALMRALDNRQAEVVLALLAKGADPNVRDGDGCTPLMHAVAQPEIAMALIAKGADVNAKDKDEGCTSLMHAARVIDDDEAKALSVKVGEILLAKGANMKAKDNAGRDVMTWAIKEGHKAFVDFLISKGWKLDKAMVDFLISKGWKMDEKKSQR